MVKHDEIKDITLLKRRGCKFETVTNSKGKTRMRIIVPRETLGIKSWGRVDFLCKVCNAFFVFSTSKGVFATANDNKSFRDIKKENKAPKLTDKTKKTKKK